MGQKIQAGQAFVQLTADDSGFRQSLQRASNALSDLGAKMFATGKIIAAAGAAMLAPFVAAMQQFTKMGSALSKLSEQTGISSRSLAELSYALDETGEKTDTLKSGLTSMAQFLDQAAQHSHAARKELSWLGLNFGELRAMSPEDQFSAIARKIGDIAEPARQTAAAMAIFGAQGDELLPLIKNLDKLRAEAVASGMIPTKEAIESAEAVGGAMRAVTKATKAFSFEIAAAFASVTKGSLATMKGAIQGVTDWVKKNQALVTQMAGVARVVAIAGAVISAIGMAFFAASTACGMLAGSITAVGAVLSALVSPFAIVTAAVVGGIAAWAMYTESGKATVQAITKFFGDLFGVAKDTIGGITAALTAGDLELAGKIAVTGLKLIFVQGMAAIANAVGGTWGDTIASLTADIAQGDLEGAWNTMVLALSALWDQFCSGIFKAFASAAKAVIGMWSSAVKSISKMMLGTPWLNKIVLAGTGVDTEAGANQRSATDAKRVALLREQLAQQKAKLAAIEKSGTDTRDSVTGELGADIAKRRIEDIQKSLGAAASEGSFQDDLEKGIDSYMDDWAKSLTTGVDDLTSGEIERRERRAAGSQKDLAGHVQGGMSEADAELAELKKQLAAQKAAADAKVAAGAKEADDAHDKRKGAAEGTADSIAGTFSAAALMSMGGTSPAEKLLGETKEARKEAYQAEMQRRRDHAETIRAIRAGGVIR